MRFALPRRRVRPQPPPVYPGLRGPSHHLESWSEGINDFDEAIADIFEVADEEGVLRVAERYLKGSATIHLHLRVRTGGNEGHAHEFCGVVASHRGDVGRRQDLLYVPDATGIPGELARRWASAVADRDAERAGPGAPDVDEAMLVYIVEPGELGEVRLRRAFSFVKGLDRLDQCPIIRAYAAKHPGVRILIPLPAFVDRELGPTGGTPATGQHDLPDEIVKRGPQVVSELSDDEPDTGIGELPSEAKDLLAGVALELTDDEAIFLVKEDVSFTVERGQVLVRTFETPIDGS